MPSLVACERPYAYDFQNAVLRSLNLSCLVVLLAAAIGELLPNWVDVRPPWRPHDQLPSFSDLLFALALLPAAIAAPLLARGCWLSRLPGKYTSAALQSSEGTPERDSAPHPRRGLSCTMDGVGRCVPLAVRTLHWEFIGLPSGFVAIEDVASASPEAVHRSICRRRGACGELAGFFLGAPAFTTSDESLRVAVDGSQVALVSEAEETGRVGRAADVEWVGTAGVSDAQQLMILHVEDYVGGRVTLEGGAVFVNPASAASSPPRFAHFLQSLRGVWPLECNAQESVPADLVPYMNAVVLPLLERWTLE